MGFGPQLRQQPWYINISFYQPHESGYNLEIKFGDLSLSLWEHVSYTGRLQRIW